MKIILASQSQNRKRLMDIAKYNYEIRVSDFEEMVDKSLSLDEQSKELAYGKAKDVFNKTKGDRIIIGADSLAIVENEQLGKPKNKFEAFEMLKKIQGRSHTVYTGLALIIEINGQINEYKLLDKSEMYVVNMSDEEIEKYIDMELPYDKAGGYSLSNSFCRFIEKIEGSYSTIEGLPMHLVNKILKEYKIS